MSKGIIKNIAIVGHLVRDRIILLDKSRTDALGGTAYSLSALGAIADNRTRIFPICNIGRDLHGIVKQAFAPYPAIDLAAVNILPIENKIHQLTYTTDSYRNEVNIGTMPTIGRSLFRSIPQIDIAWINYIGGDEFPPSHIRWLKDKFESIIYLDYHSLALGKKYISDDRQKAERFFRYNPHWRKYIEQADILQMNHVELKSIFPKINYDTQAVVEAAKKLIQYGPRAVIVTRENKELVICTRLKGKPTIQLLEVKQTKVIDPTGCGDSFGAGFIASYINECDIIKACHNGLRIAGLKAGFTGLDGFKKLKNP